MPKFLFTTDDGSGSEQGDEPIDLADDSAASDEAQRALVDMANERLPNGRRANFKVQVADEGGNEIYNASMRFKGNKPGDQAEPDEVALDEATAQVVKALKGLR